MEFRQPFKDKCNQWIYSEGAKYLNIKEKQYQRVYFFCFTDISKHVMKTYIMFLFKMEFLSE